MLYLPHVLRTEHSFPTRRSSDLMRQRQKEEARRATPRTEDRDGTENDPLHRVPDGAPTPERLTQSIELDRKSTRLNSSHLGISYAVFCLKKKNTQTLNTHMLA